MHTSDQKDTIPVIRPYFEIKEEGFQLLASLLASGQVTNNGSHVQHFERLLSDYLGVKEAVAVSTGAGALLLALKALKLPRGKAILPAYTYIATLNAVVHAGLEPVFCDIEAGTFTLDSLHLEELLGKTADARCVVPVNVFGVPANLTAIRSLCDRAGAKLLYDNAHGFGTEVNGRRLPGEADAQVFSFHATKALPAVEGGLIVSADPVIISHVRQLRNHGLAPIPSDTVSGFNAKMDELRAVIGTYSLLGFPETLKRRRYYGDRLRASFQRFEETYALQVIPPDVRTNYQNLGVCCPAASRVGLARVIELFREQGVSVRSYFDPPLYKFKGFGNGSELPVTESVWRTLISVPIHSRMTEKVLGQIEEATARVAVALSSHAQP
jgi:dTDP-4-amino-4,6-dideoxygalactose transaminase